MKKITKKTYFQLNFLNSYRSITYILRHLRYTHSNSNIDYYMYATSTPPLQLSANYRIGRVRPNYSMERQRDSATFKGSLQKIQFFLIKNFLAIQ